MNINFDKMSRSSNKEQDYIESEMEEDRDKDDIALNDDVEDENSKWEDIEGQALQSVDGSFDAKKELEDIRKMPAGKEKEDSLKLFKLRFTEQQSALGRLPEELLRELSDQDDNLLEKTEEILLRYEDEYKLSPEQMDSIRNMTDEILYKNKEVNQFYKKNYCDSKEMYKDLYGIEPKGDVEVKKGLISLAFVCSNPVDYARLYKSDSFGKSHDFVQQHYVDQANRSGGVFKPGKSYNHPNLAGTIIGVNGKPLDSKSTIEHEEQHAINRIYLNNIPLVDEERLFLELSIVENEEEAQEVVERYCTGLINESSEKAKDEIIAFKIELESNEYKDKYILKTLLKTKGEKGLYDYIDREKVLANIKYRTSRFENSSDINKAAEDIVVNKYKKLIESGMEAVNLLRTKMYSKQAMVSLLMQYPLRQWAKIAGRMPFISDNKSKVKIKELMTEEEQGLIEKIREELEKEEKESAK